MNSLGAKALFDASLALLDERAIASRGWIVHEKTFPTLDISFRDPARQELRVRLGCDDWNDSPPSVSLLAPDGSFLKQLPAQRSHAGQPSTIFHPGAHQNTGRPFVCMVGTREYHTHSSHLGDLWGNYKGLDGYTLGNIVERLWRGWLRFWP